MNKERRNYYLNQLGIDVWEVQTPRVQSNLVSQKLANISSASKSAQECDLSPIRASVVLDDSNEHANLMIIGDAPEFYENKFVEPSVRKIEQLLDAMIKSIGLKRSDLYIAHVLKSSSSDNDDLFLEELEQRRLFLEKKIEQVSPKVILALGKSAAQVLLRTEESVESLRGKLHYHNEIPIFVSYLPNYLLENQSEKSKAFSDWFSAKKSLEKCALK